MLPARSNRLRRVRPALALGLMVFLGVMTAQAFTTALDPATAAEPRVPVATTFTVKDGDTGAALAGVTVVITDGAGSQVGQGISDAAGVVTLAGIEAGTPLTAYATEPAGYVAFPVASTASDAAPVVVPLYRSKAQWTTWGMTNERLRVGPAVGLPSGGPRWAFDAGNMLEFPPTVAYGMVISASYHGFINFHRTDGSGVPVHQVYAGKFANQGTVTTWVEGSGPTAKRVARVYFAGLNGKVWCLDAFTGAEIWTRDSATTRGVTRAFKSFEASPLIVGEKLYVATRYNKNGSKAGLWALDRRTGNPLWYKQLGTRASSKIGASPAFAGGRLFVATYDGIVYALNPSNGRILWKSKVGGSLYSTPTVSGKRLFIGNKTTKMLTCLSTAKGKRLWQTKLGNPVYSSPAVWNGKVFAGSGKRVFAVKASNGRIVWKKSTAGKVLGSGSVLRGVVYFADFSGRTRGYSGRNGKVVWQFDDGRYSPITASAGTIMLTGRRHIYAFTPGP
jgi:outer membrane protein assembly factor BamB